MVHVHYKLYNHCIHRQHLLQDVTKAVQCLANDSITSTVPVMESFLLVMQTPQQQQWLMKYGNVITCMDAIYKTTKYGFPCFFLVVNTSIRIGRVVATIIPQFETTEMLAEGLHTVKQWNPKWTPKFFMTDKSPQELEAIASVHPTTVRYICDFHRAQAIERWIKHARNGVSQSQQHIVANSFKKLAYATTGMLKINISNIDELSSQKLFVQNMNVINRVCNCHP